MMKRRAPIKLCVLLLCMSLLSLSFFSCFSPTDTPELPQPYVSPYDWEQLDQENGRLYYYQDSALHSRFGVDVSEHQGWIDWQSVADDGVEFAFIRIGSRGATEGQLYLDDYFEANIEGAQQAGILIGVYFFSQARNPKEAEAEAEFVLEHLDGRRLDYPVVFDHEAVPHIGGRADLLSGEQISRCAEAFIEIIQAAGYRTMIYGNRNDLLRLDETLINSHDLWYAEYDVSHPTIQHDIIIWQYTSNGSVEGISTRTDLNIHFLVS